MSRRNLTILMIVLWVAIFGWSFLLTQITPATGDGFTRGLNRISAFVGWQVAAAVLALLIWRAGAVFAKTSTLRRVSRGPILATMLVIAGIALVIVWAMFSVPDAPPVMSTPTTVTGS